MSLRIAFDLDGVLANMESELVRQAEILFGEAVRRQFQERPAESTDNLSPDKRHAAAAVDPAAADAPVDSVPPLVRLNMTARQQRRLWRHIETIENFWQTLQEIEPGIVARIAGVATERRWEVIFLTQRPETVGATAQVQSQRWLESKGFTLPAVYVVQASRGKIAAALGIDVVIDDRPENCLDVVTDSRARAILVWHEQAEQAPAAANRLGIGVVKSVNECLNILIQIDTTARERPGMIGRAMERLGLKPSTAD